MMKVIVTKYLNVRIGKPSLNAPCYQYLAPGSEIEVDENLYPGDLPDGTFEGINTWYKDNAGNYYWSGGVEANSKSNIQLPWWITDFGIDDVWKMTKGEGVNVVTMDTGLYINEGYRPVNRFERESIFKENQNDDHGHGTLMASIIAGNGFDIYGVAPNCNLISIKIFEKKNQISTNRDNWNSLIEGLKLFKTFDKNQKYVINLSCAGSPDDETERIIQTLVDEINDQFQVVIFCAVGNDFNYKYPHVIPARLKNVIAVAGHKKVEYKRLISSNYWDSINITCPGEFPNDIKLNKFLPLPSFEFTGSSHACAFASGLASLFLSKSEFADNFYNKVCAWLEQITNEKTTKDPDLNQAFKYKLLDKDKLVSSFKYLQKQNV